MPRLQADQVKKIAADLLAGAGAPAVEAKIVASHSVEAVSYTHLTLPTICSV